MNLIDKVTGPRIANDVSPNIVALFHGLQLGWVPPESISREEYQDVRDNPNLYHPALVGFCEYGCSFGGKSWGGYATNSKGDNYARFSRNVLLKQIKTLRDVVFTCGDYQEIDIPEQSIIYCDPPYRGTTKYRTLFDHERFYQWCKDMRGLGHVVYVSEYQMPTGFECLLEVSLATILNKNQTSNRVERLYRVE